MVFHLAGYTPEHRIERLVPDGRLQIIIELDGQERSVYDNESGVPTQSCRAAWVSGVHRRYMSFSAVNDTELVAVIIPPGQGFALLHKPLCELNDKVVPAVEVFGDNVLHLREQLLAVSDSEAKIALLEEWLVGRYDASCATDQRVRNAVEAIVAAPTVATIQGLAEHVGVSRKTLAQLFRKYVGPSPKALQRILRFSAAVQMIQEERAIDWAMLSVECGYFDQSHFIRDFRAFSGYKPKAFDDAAFDRPNFFPDD